MANMKNMCKSYGMPHTWKYCDVPEMGMRFRICEKCDCLEGRVELRGRRSGWRKYAPTGGVGFVNALKERIAKEEAKSEMSATVPLTVEEVG